MLTRLYATLLLAALCGCGTVDTPSLPDAFGDAGDLPGDVTAETAADLAQADDTATQAETVTKQQYVYVGAGSDNAIAQFVVGGDGGLVAMTPATVPAGTFPAMLLADPQGRYLYAKNANDGTMSQYVIGADGTLTTNDAAFTNLGAGGFAAIHPTGKYVYVTTYDKNVHQLVVNADGTLSPNSPDSVDLTGQTTGMAFTPDGKHAYVGAFTANVVNQLAVDAAGALSPLSPAALPTGANPRQVAVTPDGAYAYVTSSDSGSVLSYKIGTDGTLASTGTLGVTAGTQPGPVYVTRNGKFLFVGSNEGIYQFLVEGDGSLKPNTPAMATLAGSASMFVSALDDQYLYAANFGGNGVSQFAISADGTLQPIAGQPANVPAGTMTWGIALVVK